MRLLNTHRRSSVAVVALGAGLVLGHLGCEMPDLAEGAREKALAEASAAAERREKFLAEGDPEAVRWLLAHRIGSGMTRDEVDQVLGQHGEQVFDDAWLKTGSTGVRQTDHAYRWGPDSTGQTYYLFFRDDHLVNHDPAEYRD